MLHRLSEEEEEEKKEKQNECKPQQARHNIPPTNPQTHPSTIEHNITYHRHPQHNVEIF